MSSFLIETEAHSLSDLYCIIKLCENQDFSYYVAQSCVRMMFFGGFFHEIQKSADFRGEMCQNIRFSLTF